jgi:hypothetical protein
MRSHLVRRAVSVRRHCHAAVFAVLVSQGQAGAQGHLHSGHTGQQSRCFCQQGLEMHAGADATAGQVSASLVRWVAGLSGCCPPVLPRCPGRQRSWPGGGTGAWTRPCPVQHNKGRGVGELQVQQACFVSACHNIPITGFSAQL